MNDKRKKTTIHDIAGKPDVTASTVSRALNDPPRLSDAAKVTELEMAKKLNYRSNSIAAALRQGRSSIAGVIVPTADRNIFASVIRGVEEVLNRSGYNVIICQSNDSTEKEKSNIRALLETQVDGIPGQVARPGLSIESLTPFVEPSLTVDRHGKQMGTFAARLSVDRVEGSIASVAAPETVLTPKLIIRNSSMRNG